MGTNGRTEPAADEQWDAVVVGGGPAGLAAAVNLARACRSVLVFDRTRPGRSDFAQVNHNYLGFSGGIEARELCERGREQARHFGAAIRDLDAAAARRTEAGFAVTAGDGSVHACRGLILATGVRDRWPTFPDVEAYVGRSVHWCIVCDGFEMQGKAVAVLGNDEHAADTALQLLLFTPRVTLVTGDGALGLRPETADRLARRGIRVIVDCIVGARASAPGALAALQLRGGGEIAVDHLFSLRGAEPETALARSLGIELSAEGYIKVDTEGRTSLAGVYAAGDVTRLFSHQIATAGHEGVTAACALNYDLWRADEAGTDAVAAVAAAPNEAEMEARS